MLATKGRMYVACVCATHVRKVDAAEEAHEVSDVEGRELQNLPSPATYAVNRLRVRYARVGGSLVRQR